MSSPESKLSPVATNTRAHETRIEIDAPIEEVWRAITEPDRLARWFAPRMSVEPGVGGFILADWGPGLEWRTLIEVWETNRHLRLTETRDRVMTSAPAAQPLEPCRLVEDFYLESQKGKTVLRLVHSGFGSGSDWDTEYEGTRGGWATCFLRLKLGLERHRNETAYNRILVEQYAGLDRSAALARLESSVPYPWDLTNRGDYHLSAVVPELNRSVVTISIQPSEAGAVVYAELLLFGLPPDECQRVEQEWAGRLKQLR
jgi:uncharacterized protein YndB with AHSA1/START domain